MSLGAFDIKYSLNTSINMQVLANFMVEFTPSSPKVMSIRGETFEHSEKTLVWQAYVDGFSNCRGVGVGIVLVSTKGTRVEKSFKLGLQASNNEVEYKAFLAGQWMARHVGADRLRV